MHRVAAIITNFNMPERTDALVKSIIGTTITPVDVILVDNGSYAEYAPETANGDRYSRNDSRVIPLRLPINVQTTNGWRMGLEYAKALAMFEDYQYFAYWFLITSAELPDDEDTLTPMVSLLESTQTAVGVHPALTPDSTTHWEHLKARGGDQPRETWMIDNISSLWRSTWFDEIGGFDPCMVYAWGIDLEMCYLSRARGGTLWVHEGCRVKKVTDIGYTMGRMGMSSKDRAVLATENMERNMELKYGREWRQLVMQEFVKDSQR